MATQPNVVLLVADQLKARSVGAYGCSGVRTPSIDALANAGTRFASAYCQSPLCMPSRSSFNTGVYPHACGVLHNPVVLDTRFATLAELLSAAGYTTGGFGHLGGDGLERGFQRKVDLVDPPIRDAYLKEQRAVRSLGHRHSSALCGAHPFPEDEVQDTVATNLALDFLGGVTGPFYLQLSFMKPHIPLLVPGRFIDLYRLEDIELPPSVADELADKPANVRATRIATRTEKIAEGALREALRHYYAATSYVDDLVGRVLAALEERGLADDTIVVFIADHGDYAGEFGVVGKTGEFYDCLTHVPWIVKGPSSLVRQGAVVKEPVGLVDLVPTLCALLGVSAPQTVQGTDLSPRLRRAPARHGEAADDDNAPRPPAGRVVGTYVFAATRGHADPRSAAVATDGSWPEERLVPLPTDPYSSGPVSHVYDGVMVRSDRYKLSVYGDGFSELYDLEDDPWERVNRAADPELASVKADLLTALIRWQMETWPAETSQTPLPYHYRATARELIPEQCRDAHATWQAEIGIADPE